MGYLTVIPLHDIEGIEITCECGTGIIVPLSVEEPKVVTADCPGCKKSLGTPKLGIENFCAFVRERPVRRVAFRVRRPSNE
jgi:hypothetical protein